MTGWHPTASHSGDPITSYLAERAHTDGGRRITNEDRVVAVVMDVPGLVAREIAAQCGLEYIETVRRLSDAKNRGRLQQGAPVKHNGRLCVTWHPVREQGRLL